MHLLRQAFTFSLLLTCFWVMQVSANELSAVEKKAATCFVCHGDKGKSGNPQWPNLAAQQSVYIVKQLNAFKSGDRIHPVMQAQAGKLTAEDINNYGAYFAVQQAAKAGGDPALAQKGKDKATACLGCHGSSGEGNGEFPRLAGQHPDYLAQQLTHFKNGSRKNDAMRAIAGNLSEEDTKALAAYFGSL
ncbi:c-type cytochrome [Methyloglobulus sp.]|uniref:c-type cytochrome n=1 Tax=Methyloglobulus sp. TaxID=2518622 RepID=UPI003989902E